MPESDIISLAKDYENQTKQLKDELYRLGWHMRGSLSYQDLFYIITAEDREILHNIIKDNIELTQKAKMPLL